MRRVRVPGDKSISHRCLMLAPLADGTSRIRGLSRGADVRSTADAMRVLGAPIPPIPADGSALEIEGPTRLASPGAVLDCGNSGTSARLLLGLLAGRAATATVDGDASLRRRPMDRVVDPLRAVGGRFRELGDPGRLPIEVRGGPLDPIDYETPVASAQVKSALLLAALGAGVRARVTEPGLSRDHTERMLGAMGAPIALDEPFGSGRRVRLDPVADLRPLEMTVPGDLSSAAYLLALAALGGAGPGLTVEGVGLNPGRTGILTAFEAMGVEIEVIDGRPAAAEPVGDVTARPSALRGVEIPPDWIPTLLDEIPVLACLAARAEGVTVVRGAAELRLKESDRLRTLGRNLTALGVDAEERPDGLVIRGTDRRLAGRIVTEGDHRIGLAFGALGALPGVEIEIDDPACVEVSYPGFWAELDRIAGTTSSP